MIWWSGQCPRVLGVEDVRAFCVIREPACLLLVLLSKSEGSLVAGSDLASTILDISVRLVLKMGFDCSRRITERVILHADIANMEERSIVAVSLRVKLPLTSIDSSRKRY